MTDSPASTPPQRHGVLISYPKSGRTWLRVLLAALDVRVEPMHFPVAPIHRAWGRHYRTITAAVANEPAIFLHRDPRDTVVSFYHQMHRRVEIPLEWRLKLGLRGRLPPRSMRRFVLSPRYGIDCVIAYNIVHARDLVAYPVAYEELVADTAGTLDRVLEYLGTPRSAAAIRAAVADNTFERMQARERSLEHPEAWLRPGRADDPSSYKVRVGRIGNYRDELDAATAAALDRRLAETRYVERMAALLPEARTRACSTVYAAA